MTPEEMTDQKSIKAEPPGARKLARVLMARMEERCIRNKAASDQDVENWNRWYRLISGTSTWVSARKMGLSTSGTASTTLTMRGQRQTLSSGSKRFLQGVNRGTGEHRSNRYQE
jgi:hypothetical protein